MRYQGKVTKYYRAGMSVLTTQQFPGDASYLCCRWCAAADTGAAPAASTGAITAAGAASGTAAGTSAGTGADTGTNPKIRYCWC